jgi:hypothetical protein
VIRYRFPGFFEYLAASSARTGLPDAELPARKNPTLSALANLCAQAGCADPAAAAGIVAKAAEFRDQLLVAYEAAELILEETRKALGLPASTPVEPSEPTSGQELSSAEATPEVRDVPSAADRRTQTRPAAVKSPSQGGRERP